MYYHQLEDGKPTLLLQRQSWYILLKGHKAFTTLHCHTAEDKTLGLMYTNPQNSVQANSTTTLCTKASGLLPGIILGSKPMFQD
jgi:hypothetical protein